MPSHGGARVGAGRPKGSRDASTKEHRATISELAREHVDTALGALVSIIQTGESESARVAAANSLLDRGFGKPVQSTAFTDSEGNDLPTSLSMEFKNVPED